MEKYKYKFTLGEIRRSIDDIEHLEKRELRDFYEDALRALLDAYSHIEYMERNYISEHKG